MFLSSSCIIVKANSVTPIDEFLRNSHFTQPKKGIDDYAFYSINFYNPEKTIGEIHWSESFHYGKMNLINFMRKNNTFILFTSSVQNYKILSYILEQLFSSNLKIEIVKIPLDYQFDEHEIKEIVSIESQNAFGISVILNIDEKYSLLKIYSNGLITYSMTNDQITIEKTIDIALKIIKLLKVGDGF